MDRERMKSGDFIAWCPAFSFVHFNCNDDVGFDLFDHYQQFDYGILTDEEKMKAAEKSGDEANQIIQRLMKRDK
ncbi:MAG: hypothetical protein CMI54_01375 [Parcubacteria group bacterium]|nr:hypothetical protein [Parcubacteria group bacterium]|tara:strand:- start:4717 stop:4938 length:222 start_codon:yes stop_codon:yes gene_type:complete